MALSKKTRAKSAPALTMDALGTIDDEVPFYVISECRSRKLPVLDVGMVFAPESGLLS